MSWIALQILLYDKAKYGALVVGITMATGLMAQQSAILWNVLAMTAGPLAVLEAPPVWVMDPRVQSVDAPTPLRANDVMRVRGVAGVAWAVPLLTGSGTVKTVGKTVETVEIFGLDDSTLTGLPRHITLGSAAAMFEPDAVMLDRAGFARLFPQAPLQVGMAFEINDTLVRLVGIIETPGTFSGLPMLFTRLRMAQALTAGEESPASYVLATPDTDVDPATLARRIATATGLQALTREAFQQQTLWYYVRVSGIAENFAVTIVVGLLVGAIVVGQTFYMFAIEHLTQFAALKAIGVTNRTVLGMVCLQALYVGIIGLAFGMGLSSAFFVVMDYPTSAFRDTRMPVPIALGTAVAVILMVASASIISARRLLHVEPALVFRG